MRSTFIDPGRLRTELSLQEPGVETDDSGGQLESWSEVGTVMALVEPAGASDFFGADQRMQRITHRITLRHRPGVAAGMRFARAGRNFQILTVQDPDETGRYLVCRAREDFQ
jgi:SPP1 family predicted phage head-tail adaptor